MLDTIGYRRGHVPALHGRRGRHEDIDRIHAGMTNHERTSAFWTRVWGLPGLDLPAGRQELNERKLRAVIAAPRRVSPQPRPWEHLVLIAPREERRRHEHKLGVHNASGGDRT